MREARAWAMDRQRNGGHDPFAVFCNPKDQKHSQDGSIECLLHCGSCSCRDMDFIGVKKMRQHFGILSAEDTLLGELIIKYRFRKHITVSDVNATASTSSGFKHNRDRTLDLFRKAAAIGIAVLDGAQGPKRRHGGDPKARMRLQLQLAEMQLDARKHLVEDFDLLAPPPPCTCTWKGLLMYRPCAAGGWRLSISATGKHDDKQHKHGGAFTARQKSQLRLSKSKQVHGKLVSVN